MATKRKDISDELLASLHEAVEIQAGVRQATRMWAPPKAVDVKGIRKRRGLSQVAFAHRYGFSPDAVRDWEQGRRRPEQAARTLLLVIDSDPDAVERVLEPA